MLVAWRACKRKYHPWDGAGAEHAGGRWNSPGRPVIYAADSFAGSLLEILAHSARPRTLPGPHHAISIEIPDALIERLEPGDLAGWHLRDSRPARAFGDAWLDAARSAVLVVPALPSRPVGRAVLVNPRHPAADRIRPGRPFAVPWDERLF
jgi:RES domain-containing protein